MEELKQGLPPLADRIKIGSVPYLNSKVLIWGLDEKGRNENYQLTLEPPSILAKQLRDGDVDIALVSSIEFFRAADPGYRILPNISVSGRQTMWSIKLFHHKPLTQLKRVGLDPSSETTNGLLKIILEQKFQMKVEYATLQSGEDPTQRSDLDGFLKIGDPALRFKNSKYEALDLLGQWTELTGLPFVFAVWLVRDGVQLGPVEQLLIKAKAEGLANTDAVAKAYCNVVGISFEAAQEYVSHIIRYDLDQDDLKGFEEFGRRLKELSLINNNRALKFYFSS